MKTQTISLIKQSFGRVAPFAEEAASVFYARLFELDPSLRHLFHNDMKQQGAKLMATLTLVVNGLEKPETIIAAVLHLGKRHAGYGVRDEHYATVGQALLDTFALMLGEDFTPEVKAAWLEAYTLLAELMQEAAAQVKPMVEIAHVSPLDAVLL